MKYNFKVSLPSVVEYGANSIEKISGYINREYIKLYIKNILNKGVLYV